MIYTNDPDILNQLTIKLLCNDVINNIKQINY